MAATTIGIAGFSLTTIWALKPSGNSSAIKLVVKSPLIKRG